MKPLYFAYCDLANNKSQLGVFLVKDPAFT